MPQRVVHQVTRVLAPGCVPLFLTDGLKDYGTALLTHFGFWMQPERRQDKGPLPKPRCVEGDVSSDQGHAVFDRWCLSS